MARKATRTELFNAAERICGRIFAIEMKYGELVRNEMAHRNKRATEMGIRRVGFV